MFDALVPNQIITGNGTVYERSLGETQFRRLPGKAWIRDYYSAMAYALSLEEMQDAYDRAMHGSPKFRPNYVRYYDFDSMSKAWNEEFAAWTEEDYTYDHIRYDESAPIPDDSWPAEEIEASEHEIR